MRRFIKDIFIFIIPLLLFIPFTALYYYTKKLKIASEFKQISSYETLIMGDSQMQRINPELFSLNTYNFSNTGEHYFFTYQKIIWLLSMEDHNIKQIILGVSAHNFSPFYERLFDIKGQEGKASLRRNVYFLELSDNDFFDFDDLVTIGALKGIYSKPDWGGFKNSVFANPDSLTINKMLKIHYLKGNADTINISEQIEYLFRIDSICNANDIRLFLVTAPYHPSYLNQIDSIYIDLLEQTVSSLKNVNCINYLNYNVDPKIMSDAVHLNSEGSVIFSKMINDTLNSMIHNPGNNF